MSSIDYNRLAWEIRQWSRALGFQQLGISDTQLEVPESHLEAWLAEGCHGEMAYMARHGRKRSRPEWLVPGTLRIISVRMDYLQKTDDPWRILADSELGYVSRYALGRDYHRLMRNRLQKLALQIKQKVGGFGYRAFVDSAPVMEKPLAQKAGLGWQGKHTNLVSRAAGCWFFLGELYTDLPLPVDESAADHCGNCRACLDICPTGAITAPYKLDARRCISYLTIELQGSIPKSLRPLIGNRIYGCDDCLLVCPWNRFALPAEEAAFEVRNGLDSADLVTLFNWSESEFMKGLEGSPIRRIGHEQWQRNIAVALGNASTKEAIITALEQGTSNTSSLVAEHARWGLEQHARRGRQPLVLT